MSIFEYDKELEEEKLRKAEYEAGFSEGEKYGHEAGFSEGEKHGNRTKFLSKLPGACFNYRSSTPRKNCCDSQV